MGKKGIFAVLVLLMLPLVSAQLIISPSPVAQGDIIVKYTPVKDMIQQGEEASFNISFYNPTENDEELDFYFVTDYIGKFSPLTDPIPFLSSTIKLRPDERKSAILKLKSVNNIDLGIHRIIVGVRSLNTEKKTEVMLNVRVYKEVPVYDPDVSITLSAPQYVDIAKKMSIKVNVVNNNPLDIPNLKVGIYSQFFDKETYIELEPDSQKTVDFTVDFGEALPQKIEVKSEASYQDEVLSSDSKVLEILPYVPSFELSSETVKGVLSETTVVGVKNNGNIQKNEKVSLEAGKIKRWLSSTDPSAELLEQNGKMVYTWDVTLNPNKRTELVLKTSYLWPALILLLVIISLIIYVLVKDPIVVIKNVHEISRSGGAVSLVKVMIIVKNRKNRSFNDLRVIDRVNELVTVDFPKGPGFMRPAKTYKHAKEGQIIEWKLDVIEPSEERMFVYEIKPKLSIIGNIKLEPTLVKYKEGEKDRKVYSNSLSIES